MDGSFSLRPPWGSVKLIFTLCHWSNSITNLWLFWHSLAGSTTIHSHRFLIKLLQWQKVTESLVKMSFTNPPGGLKICSGQKSPSELLWHTMAHCYVWPRHKTMFSMCLNCLVCTTSIGFRSLPLYPLKTEVDVVPAWRIYCKPSTRVADCVCLLQNPYSSECSLTRLHFL